MGLLTHKHGLNDFQVAWEIIYYSESFFYHSIVIHLFLSVCV